MKRTLSVPLTSRIAPVFGAILVLVGLIGSSELHLVGVVNADAPNSPAIATDKGDYVPGETVTITGSGWIPGQPVALHIEESDGDLPWDATAIPDAAGNFSNSDFVIQTHDVGVLFTLTATQGDLSAVTEFTDVVGSGNAPNGDPGDFEIQGNVLAAASSGQTDWLANGANTTGLLTSAGVPLNSTVTYQRHDAANGTASTADDIFSSSHKTGDDPNTYTWKTASADQKDDLNNVYVHVSTDTNGDRWITASADRASNNGTAFVDFEMNQATLSQIADAGCSSPPCGHFETNPLNASTGGRTPNDVMVTSQYNSGGSKATILVYQWKLVSGQYQWSDITASIPSTCGPLHNQSCAYVATNVVDGVSVPYGAFGVTTYFKNQFVETSLDVSSLIKAAIDPCVGIEVRSVFVKTKVSTSSSAVLDDFVTPISLSFNAGFTITPTATPVKCFGGSDGSITVSADGGTAPYTVTLNGGAPQIISINGGSVIFTGLGVGTYNVHVVATGGCTKDNTIDVTQPTVLGSSISSQTNVSCHGGSDGSVTVAGSGGTTPYTYSIDGANFQSNGTFSNLSAGNYTVTVKDANGCTQLQSVTITEPATGISASETTSPASCNGGSDGSVTVSVNGGTPPYSVMVNGVTHTNVTTSTTFTGLASGAYPASVSDAHGCSGSATGILVDQPTAISASETTAPASCHGANDGSVTVSVSGGTAPYSVTVSGVTHTGVTGSATFTGLASGTYAASITDAHGCSGSATGVLVDQPAAISASETASPASCNGGSDGSVTVSVSGGNAPYSVTVNGVTHIGVTSNTTFTGLTSGTYPASVTDAHGCSGTATGVLVDQPASISASETTASASCHGGSDGTVTVTVSGGTAPYSVTVNGVTHSGITSGTTFTGLSSGTYPASITDAHGCLGSATGVLVDQPAAINASETTSPASCNGGSDGSVTVSVSGGTAPYSVIVNGVTHTGITSSTTFTGLSSGSYSAIITDAHDCAGSAIGVLVDQPAAINASETTSPTSCNGNNDGSVTVSVSGGTVPYSVTVNGVTHTGVTSNTTFTGLASGTYPASVTDAHGCSGSATGVLVDQPAAINALETTAPASCNGGSDGSVTVSVSGGTAPYTVTVDGVTHAGISGTTTFTGLASGAYPASITDAHGCSGSAVGVLVDQPQAISASETTSPASCNGGSDGSVTVSVSGGTAPYSVTVNGVTHTGVSGSTIFTGLSSGTYPATITDAHGCSGSAAGVLVDQPISISASETTAPASCHGGDDGSVTVSVSGGTAPYSVTVSGVTHTGVTGSTTFTGLASGTYAASITDAHGCSGSATGVLVDQPAAISASETTSPASCNGNDDGSVTVTISGGTAPYSVTVNGVTKTGVSSSTTFAGLASGTYAASITDAHGCSGSATGVLVGQPSTITASALATNPSCNGGTGSITVTASGGTGTLTYSKDGTNFQASNVFSGLGDGSYTITVKDANGCSTTAGATVTSPTPVTTSSNKVDPLCSSGLGSMTVTFAGGTPGYECSLDNGAFAACSSPATFNNLSAGSHTVSVQDSHGCTGAIQTQTIIVPQALSPSITTTPPSAFNTNDGTMTVSVSGGVAPYNVTVNNVTHTISTVGGSSTFTGLAASDYPITIVDANGCGIGIAATVPVAPATVEAHLCSILSSIGSGGKTIFMVTLPGGALSQPLAIFYKMSGTAIAGVDYSLSGTYGQIIVPAGKTSATVTITALKNKARKSNRIATMTIVNGPGYFTTSGSNIATVTIRK